MTNAATLTESQLRQFTGSENWYRHGINRSVLYTDGAQFLAEQGGAYWLLDIIAIAQQHESRVAQEEFQVWKLKVSADPVQPSSATMAMTTSFTRRKFRSRISR